MPQRPAPQCAGDVSPARPRPPPGPTGPRQRLHPSLPQPPPTASSTVPPGGVGPSPAARRRCRRAGRAPAAPPRPRRTRHARSPAALRGRDGVRPAPAPRARPRCSPRSRAPRSAPRSDSVPISPITASSACRRPPGGAAVSMATGPAAVSMATPRPLLQSAVTGAPLLKRAEALPDWPSWIAVLRYCGRGRGLSMQAPPPLRPAHRVPAPLRPRARPSPRPWPRPSPSLRLSRPAGPGWSLSVSPSGPVGVTLRACRCPRPGLSHPSRPPEAGLPARGAPAGAGAQGLSSFPQDGQCGTGQLECSNP